MPATSLLLSGRIALAPCADFVVVVVIVVIVEGQNPLPQEISCLELEHTTLPCRTNREEHHHLSYLCPLASSSTPSSPLQRPSSPEQLLHKSEHELPFLPSPMAIPAKATFP